MRTPYLVIVAFVTAACLGSAVPAGALITQCGDVLGNGDGINATDALGVLRRAVGQPLDFTCDQCVIFETTTTSTTTTTLNPQVGAECTMPPTVRAGADLRNCDLADFDFGFDSLCGADLRGADISRVRLRAGDFADFRGATANSANLSFGSYVGARFDGLTGDTVDFGFGDVRDTSYVGASMANGDFFQTILDDVDFSSAMIPNGNMNEVTGARVNFTGADLTGLTWRDGSLTDTVWSGTTCPDGSNSDANGGTCCGHNVGTTGLTQCSP